MPMFSRLRCEECGSTFSQNPPEPHRCEDGPRHYTDRPDDTEELTLSKAEKSMAVLAFGFYLGSAERYGFTPDKKSWCALLGRFGVRNPEQYFK